MNIEPEALYSLFDTLIIPIEKPINSLEIDQVRLNAPTLILFLKSECTSAETEFLRKIYASIGLSSTDVELNILKDSDAINDQIKGKSGTLLLWGIEYDAMEKYSPKIIKDATIIALDALQDIINNPVLKSKLWNCLKPLFLK